MVTGSARRPILVASGEFAFPDRRAFAKRLSDLHDAICLVVAQFEPSEAAVEAPFHGVSARSALQLAHARGVVLAALGKAGVPVFEYTPATIKKSVTGNGRAEKAQVQSMVGRLIPASATERRADVADAIATAICHLAASSIPPELRAERPSR